jgi:hypothetical protein
MGAAERITAIYDSSIEDVDASDVDRWCVDAGSSIDCMSTRQVWMALAQGKLDPSTPVWREGFGHWLSISEVVELTQDEEDARITVPEQSEIRVRKQSLELTPTPDDEHDAQPLPLVRPARIRTAFARLITAPSRGVAQLRSAWRRPRTRGRLAALLGVALGAATALSIWAGIAAWRRAHPTLPRVQRVVVDVVDRARFVSAQADARATEDERAWWRERWK